ncbi:MAG: hypothetical protein ACTHU0_07285 [Kofleriaceae bacterium]
MAAVFALVFMFALASTALFVKALGAFTLSSVCIGVLFGALAAGVFLGLYNMVKGWEEEPLH